MSHSPVIAHLLYPGSFGGAESVVRSLAVGRAAAGRPTHLLAGYRNDADNPLFGALRSGGVHVTPFRSRGRHYAGEIGAVARLLRELGIELLHTHVYRSDFLGYGAARRAGIPVVSTFHGETGGSPANRFYEWSVKRLFRRFDGVICVSEANRRKLRKARSDGPNVWVVPNGVAPARPRRGPRPGTGQRTPHRRTTRGRADAR